LAAPLTRKGIGLRSTRAAWGHGDPISVICITGTEEDEGPEPEQRASIISVENPNQIA